MHGQQNIKNGVEKMRMSFILRSSGNILVPQETLWNMEQPFFGGKGSKFLRRAGNRLSVHTVP